MKKEVPTIKDNSNHKKNQDCIELKNIQYKTMLEKGNNNFIIPSKNNNFQNLASIENILDKERETYKLVAWNKLNNTIKRQKIDVYVDEFSQKNNLSNDDKKLLLDSILKYLNKNMLNKAKDVSYDKEKGVILDIPILEYNHSNKRYTLRKISKALHLLKREKKLKNLINPTNHN